MRDVRTLHTEVKAWLAAVVMASPLPCIFSHRRASPTRREKADRGDFWRLIRLKIKPKELREKKREGGGVITLRVTFCCHLRI